MKGVDEDAEDMCISPNPNLISSQVSAQCMSASISCTPAEGLYEETCDEEEWDSLLAGLSDAEFASPLPPIDTNQHMYAYEGVNVCFPYEAYESQTQMMEKIIHGVNNGFNCLLESPTGTGKTAALLCSLLAWKKWYCDSNNYREVAKKVKESLGKCTCGFLSDPDKTKVVITKSKYGRKFKVTAVSITEESKEKSCETEENEDSRNSPKKLKVANARNSTVSSTTVKEKLLTDLCRYCIKTNFKESGPPRIYYATRTHSQIAQVVKQLKQTRYRNAKMTILASREQTCINEKVKDGLPIGNVDQNQEKVNNGTGDQDQDKVNNGTGDQNQDNQEKTGVSNVNDGCRTLRINYFENRKEEKKRGYLLQKREECRYYTVGKFPENFKPLQNTGAWDIEDVKGFGHGCTSCPYYGSMALQESSDIIFCPYNYLIGPEIRQSTNVELTNSIIVFDEAHNIEDICRDAASFCINNDKLDLHVRQTFDKPLQSYIPPTKRPAVEHFSCVLLTLSSWILRNGKNTNIPTNENSQAYLSFLDTDILCLFESIGLGPETLEKHEELLKILDDDDEFEDSKPTIQMYTEDQPVEEAERTFKIASEGISFVRKLISMLPLLFDNIKDYKVILVNTGKQFKINPAPSLPKVPLPTRRASSTDSKTEMRYNYTLDILCLNPAVAFRPIKNAAHSIIVASGTLSPLTSFSSELNTPFEVNLSANHVVNPAQVWAGVVKYGPSAMEFNLSKKFQDEALVQDEIGHTIFQISEKIPHGVLVFLPSYGLMNTLKNRWSRYPENKPLLNELRKLKFVYFEESRSKEMFLKDMKNYKDNISNPSMNGCILFAVFRGKVSEGIDFADNQARAVITVGIPYSNCFAYGVVGKKAYNDTKRRQVNTSTEGESSMNLLSGYEWYKVQAFRAMNQGFGRCIRHQKDWGAIVILESRLASTSNNKYLSKWVLQHLRQFEKFDSVKRSLASFVEHQAEVEEELSIREEELTQLCQVDPKYAPTQLCHQEKPSNMNAFPTPSSSNALNSLPRIGPEELNSSTFSIDDFDEADLIFNSPVPPAPASQSKRLQVVHVHADASNETHSEGSDVSYHSDSMADADTSVDFMMGTP